MNCKIRFFALVKTREDVREYMGMSYIKAYLDNKGLLCSAETICEDEMDKILASFEEFPKLIGLSMYCNTIDLVRKFTKKVKDISKECHIVGK